VVWASDGVDEYVGSVKGLSGIVWGVFLRICLRLRLIFGRDFEWIFGRDFEWIFGRDFEWIFGRDFEWIFGSFLGDDMLNCCVRAYSGLVWSVYLVRGNFRLIILIWGAFFAGILRNWPTEVD
jgi:hypothetical protein